MNPANQELPGRSGRRRAVFRVLALAVPALAVLLLELALRLAGYGYPTQFFLPDPSGRPGVFIENQWFGWKYFPRAAARSPLPLSVKVPKPPDAFRVLVLGESAAMGDPEPSYGVARQLERILQSLAPGRKVEVLNLAMTAINSHVMREIARNAAFLQADAWVIYAGNNEVVGPFGAGTVFGRRAAPLWFVRARLWMRKSRVVQLLEAATQRGADSQEWKGMELFLQHRIRQTDPQLRRVESNFAANLADTIEVGRKAGAKVVLATMAVNLTACPPFGSSHGDRISAELLASWERNFAEGVLRQSEGQSERALRAFTAAREIDPGHAELSFRIAQCYSAMGQPTNAEAFYSSARDADTLRFRADSTLNAVIAGIARRKGAVLIGAAARLETAGRDSELFLDHVHLSFEGNHRLATMFAEALAPGLGVSNSLSFPEAKAVAQSLAYTSYDERRIVEEMRERLRHPPFTFQLSHEGRDAALSSRLRALLEEPPSAHIPTYRAAIKERPDDWVLHARFARLLESGGDLKGARAEWETVSRLLPHIPEPWFQLGDMALEQEDPRAAIPFFEAALRLKPDMLEGLNGLGLAYSALGQTKPARAFFQQALAIKPSYATARVNLGTELARAGQTGQAEAEFRRVLAGDTNNVPARINLGKLMFAQDKPDEAARLFKEAILLDDGNAIAHFNLANTLASMGRHEQAIECYRAAVSRQPKFVEARYELAMQLSRMNRITEALPQLAEVVRLQPGMTEAHYNYGIALAREGRLDQAINEFRATLEQNPSHTQARASLQRATEMSAGRSGKREAVSAK